LTLLHSLARFAPLSENRNIVQIYDIGEIDGRLYLSLEYVEGGSLYRHTREGAATPQQAASLVETLARTMVQRSLPVPATGFSSGRYLHRTTGEYLRAHTSYVYPVAFSPDGRWFASGSWDGTIRLSARPPLFSTCDLGNAVDQTNGT
jgi:WD40 repeat protein